jgi:radical SAM superfamily enzyme YgiQ (UPF0313 family)
MTEKRIKNILFIEVKSPFHHIFSRTTIPRLGSVLLATILNNNGYKAHVIIEDVKEFDSSMLEGIDLVAISSITSTAPRAYDMADECREKGVPVVMGGPHVTFLPDEALMHCDYVIRGEGERPIVELLNALNDGAPLNTINGLSYKADKVYHNENEDFVKDLDSLPTPDFSTVEAWDAKNVIPFASSRGCPFRCKFCSVIKMFGTQMRYLSVDRVIEDVKEYLKKTDHIFFCDDNFTANKKRTKEIARRFIDEGIDIEWSAQVRVDAAKDEELLDLMYRSGCCTVFIGFESVNPKTLLAYDKKQSIDDIRHAIETFHKHNISIHGMFVLGSDEDNIFTIKNTAKFAVETKLGSVQFLVLTPLPGTDTYSELKAKGLLISDDWKLYDSHHAVFKPKNMSAYELQVGAFKAMGKFYSWRNSFRHLFSAKNINTFFKSLTKTKSLKEAAKDGFFYFFVNIYGRYSIRKALRDNKENIASLKASLYADAKKIKSSLYPSFEKIKKVIIPEGILSKKEQRFLYYFMKNIGIKAQFITAKINPSDLKSGIADFINTSTKSIKSKASVIMMPVIEKGMPSFENTLQDTAKELLSNIKNIKLLPLNIGNSNPYNYCVSLGLAFDKKLKKINKAYFLALEKAQLQF